MRKILPSFIFALFAAVSAWAQTFTVNNLKYEVTDKSQKTVDVTGYESKPEGLLEIPETVNYNGTDYSVRNIAAQAFEYCDALTQITLGNNITSIGEMAFSNCTALTQFFIPNSVTYIGDQVFFNCPTLTQINVDSENTVYCSEDGILFNKDKTTLIKYPEGKTEASYTVPNSVINIDFGSIRYCLFLKEIFIPKSVTNIYYEGFPGCSALTQINVDSTNTVYCSEDGVLFNKEKTKLLQYPASKKGSAYTVPNSITNIQSSAFAGCNALTQVTIPNSVTNIGLQAFHGCSALTQINIENGNTVYCSEDGVLFNKDKTKLIQYPSGKTEPVYTIPNSVTYIEFTAFTNCAALTQITIGDRIEYIGYFAFANCHMLQKMTVLALVPPILDGSITNYDIQVYVPAESLEIYKTTEGWKELNNLQAISSTAIQAPTMPESISVYGSQLHNPQRLSVNIYDMQGRLVYCGNDITVSLSKGMHIISCAGASCKVMF